MKYTKPSISELGDPVKMIQHHLSKPSEFADNACPTDNNGTAAAYEADE